jgi:hypothetical protein
MLDIAIAMTKCPNCQNEISKPDKTWKYSQFTVERIYATNAKPNSEITQEMENTASLQLKQGRYRKKA